MAAVITPKLFTLRKFALAPIAQTARQSLFFVFLFGNRVRVGFLNDLHLGVALRHARERGWVVRTNPYEGGSDHTSFTRVGVPALLNWHFTDRYYHTNLDTIDKVSAAEMGRVATVVATTATFLAAADHDDVEPLARLLRQARARDAKSVRQHEEQAKDGA